MISYDYTSHSKFRTNTLTLKFICDLILVNVYNTENIDFGFRGRGIVYGDK